MSFITISPHHILGVPKGLFLSGSFSSTALLMSFGFCRFALLSVIYILYSSNNVRFLVQSFYFFVIFYSPFIDLCILYSYKYISKVSTFKIYRNNFKTECCLTIIKYSIDFGISVTIRVRIIYCVYSGCKSSSKRN